MSQMYHFEGIINKARYKNANPISTFFNDTIP
jgi:hypothetical protein